MLGLFLACSMLTGCVDAQVGPRAIVLEAGNSETMGAPFRFFASSSVWNAPLSSSAPLDPHSAEIVGQLDAEVATEEQSGRGPGINTTAWSVPIYTVPAHQPAVRVRLRSRPERRPSHALSRAWRAVPLPADAQPAVGTDRQLVVWQPSTGRMWEFWELTRTAEGWQAAWGGAMRHTRGSSGVYGPQAWPGGQSQWGATAALLPLVGGLITLEDLEKHQINHALAMAIPQPRAGVYASPASGDDGTSTSPLSLPEGAHLRLDPKLDLASLHLPPVTLELAEAAQRYGIIIRDHAGSVVLYGQDPTPTGTDPYIGPTSYLEGVPPGRVVADFPWAHLQLLAMQLHRDGRG